MKEKTSYRIGNMMVFILVFFAFLADIIGLIPFAKDITATAYWAIVSIYLTFNGVKVFSGRKLATMAISLVVSWIPILQEIPIEIVAGILAIIFITRFEDKAKISILNPLGRGQKVTLPQRRIPLYEGGVRRPRTAEDDDLDMAA